MSADAKYLRKLLARRVGQEASTPGLLRDEVCGYPAGTLVRWVATEDYLEVRAVLPDGETVVCHEDDLVVPRVS